MTNCKAFYLDVSRGAEERAAATECWQSLVDLSDFGINSSSNGGNDFTVYGLLPTKIRLEQLRVLRGHLVKMSKKGEKS